MNFYNVKKENIKIIIEQVLHIPGLPIRLVFQQKIAKQTGHIGGGLHEEKYEAHLIVRLFKFTKTYNAYSGLTIYNYVNGISKFKA